MLATKTKTKTKTVINENQTVNSFLANVANQNIRTAGEYKKRLNLFAKFIGETYNLSLDELVTTLNIMGHGPRIDVYDMSSKYVNWLKRRGTMTPRSIKTWLSTARHYLEVSDVEISPRKWQLKVKTPKVVGGDKEALSKEDIQIILNACSSIKLKTYLLFLVATGCRATEALSIRLCDINFNKDPATGFIRGKFTKTQKDKHLFLTRELAEQLKSWIKFKYRTRNIGYYDSVNKRTINKVVKPVVNDKLLLFSTNTVRDPHLNHLYTTYLMTFERTLDRLGGKYAEFENDEDKKRRKFSFHSLRRYTKGVISDLGFADYSEYYLAHKTSSYYTKTDKEKIELFRKCEPSLTFLDYSNLERRGNDMQTKFEVMERKYMELEGNMHKLMEMIQENPKLAQVKPEALIKKK